MSTFSIPLKKDRIDALKNTFREYIKPSPNPYMDTFIQKDGLSISIYTSGKVVFQGDDAFFYASAYLEVKEYRQAGSDEVGTGDFFGPVVVVGAVVEESDFAYIKEQRITDSKAMNDEKIMELGPELRKRFKHSLLILDNPTYNRIHETNNLNMIKARMHNQAYLNLLHKGVDLPKACVVDQFAPEQLYYSYLKNEKEVYRGLTFETKAESHYPAVAVASCIARYVFLVKMKEMDEKYGMHFPLGASDAVDDAGVAFVKKYGAQRLSEVSKTHFKNSEYILDQAAD